MKSISISAKLARASGCALGLGLSPIMPGTCGALLGVALHGAIAGLLPEAAHFPALLAAFLVVSALTVGLTPWAEAHWGCADPPHFVLDEVAGYLFVPLLFREWQAGACSFWKTALWGFLLFRILDIFKLLPPARLIDEELRGPWGVLLDDLVSAGYAALILHLIYWFAPDAWLR